MANILDDLIIETLDNYKDIEFLNNLAIANTMRYGKDVKNYALQNIFKIYT